MQLLCLFLLYVAVSAAPSKPIPPTLKSVSLAGPAHPEPIKPDPNQWNTAPVVKASVATAQPPTAAPHHLSLHPHTAPPTKVIGSKTSQPNTPPGSASSSSSSFSSSRNSPSASRSKPHWITKKSWTQTTTKNSKPSIPKHTWHKNSTMNHTSHPHTKNSTVSKMQHSSKPTRSPARSKSKKSPHQMPTQYGTREPRKPLSLDELPLPQSDEPHSELSPRNFTVNYILDIDLTWMNSSNYVPNGTLGWVCVNHFSKHLLFDPNNTTVASPGLKQLAETGNLTNITIEFETWLSEKKIGSVFHLPTHRQASPSTATMMVNVSAEYPMISCAARLEPSANWLTGLVDVNLHPDGSDFIDAVQVILETYDAGSLTKDVKKGVFIPERVNVTTVRDSRVRGQIGFVTFGIA